MVATSTAAEGRMPAERHLMSMNFSAPRSTKARLGHHVVSGRRPAMVAITLLQPWACGEGATVNKRRCALESLHKVR